MSGVGSFVAGTIEDILVSLAEGIRDAQDRLNALEPFDEYGRPRPQYFLPELDFTLKINAVETSTTQVAPGDLRGATGMPMLSRGAAQVGFLPQRASALNFAIARPSTTSTATNEVYSTISGRFVAVPPNEGMPQIGLTISASPHPGAPAKRMITVRGAYATGGPVSGATVEFNIDPVGTASLNGLPSPVVINQLALFGSGAALTDATGIATTEIDLAAAPAGAPKLLVVANLGPVRASLLIGGA